MKRIKPRRPKSFILTCTLYFILYSLIAVGILMFFEGLVNHIYIRSIPDYFFPFDHMEELEAENYSKLNVAQYNGVDILVLDTGGQVIYASNEELAQNITPDDIELISDDDTYYSFYNYEDETLGKCTLILKCLAYYSETSFNGWEQAAFPSDFTEYCILDSDLNIISGELFSPRTSVTDEQLELLCGTYDAYHYVQRTSFETASGEQRILLWFQDQRAYGDDGPFDRYEHLQRLRYVSIPIIISMLLIFSVLIIRKLSRSLAPLNRAILAYGSGERVNLAETQVPTEFHSVVDNLDRMLDQIEESRDKAEQANAEKQRIIANLSHDLKTPLTVIQGYALALSDDLIPEEKKQQYYQVIYDRTQAMGELLDSLLKYSRMERTNYEIAAESLDFSEFCRRYLSAKYQEIELGGFELDIDIPECPIPMEIDQALMRRALDNLIGNAMKYNPVGTKILFQLKDGEDCISLIVADNGNGIPVEIGQAAFEPMVSGNRARTSGGGSGMGLSIVRSVVELHGGFVTLDQDAEGGYITRFTIVLPKHTK